MNITCAPPFLFPAINSCVHEDRLNWNAIRTHCLRTKLMICRAPDELLLPSNAETKLDELIEEQNSPEYRLRKLRHGTITVKACQGSPTHQRAIIDEEARRHGPIGEDNSATHTS